MKKTKFLLVVLVTLLLTTPALASPKEPVGEQITLYCDENPCTGDYTASTAFHISHGWGLYPTWGDMPGQFSFKLELDGATVEPTYVARWTEITEWGPVLQNEWVYNYPDGMIGEHTFAGSWIGPCGLALELGLTDECANPMADFAYLHTQVVITFQ